MTWLAGWLLFPFIFALGTAGLQPPGVVQALFDLESPAGGPFPSDRFTAIDASHNTGLRVNLPLPDCAVRVSDCEDLDVINTLDGFSLQPRLSIPFDGPIDVGTVTSDTVFLISMGSTLPDGKPGGGIIGINQVVWDPDSNVLHAESDELLDQHTRYALIVTRGVHDLSGSPVEASEAFRRFRHDVRDGATKPSPMNGAVAKPPGDSDMMWGNYKHALLEAIKAAREAGVQKSDIVSAGVFTTQSTTAVLEKIRDQIKATTPAPPDFNLSPEGGQTVFNLDDVTGITWNQQTHHDPDQFKPMPLSTELAALHLIPGAVGRIAYGKYASPEYLVHPGEVIPPVATRTGTPRVTSIMEVYFNVVLPSGPTPPNGWPVAIYGTGAEGTKDTWLLRVAASMAAQGIATVSINFYGRGFGPLSTISIQRASGAPVMFLAGGRSIDQNSDGVFGGTEGFQAVPSMIYLRDSYRQTVVDWMQLVRVIQSGVDVDGDGIPDLDPSRIYYFGNSTGANMGTMLLAVEPDIHAGVLNAASGSVTALDRLSGVAGRMRVGQALAARQPPLLNSPGVSTLDGVGIPAPFFSDNLPLRNGLMLPVGLADGTDKVIRSPVVNTVTGAMEIQEFMDRREWVGLAGDPLGYAAHVRKTPLAGVRAKSMIVQFGKGDMNAPNPTETALVRAGDLADRVTFYRHDSVLAEDSTLDKNPHQFLIRVVGNAGERRIALAYQGQIAAFFASGGNEVMHPEPARFFEVPILLPLPEGLNFIPRAGQFVGPVIDVQCAWTEVFDWGFPPIVRGRCAAADRQILGRSEDYPASGQL